MTAVLDLGTGFTEAVEQAIAKALAAESHGQARVHWPTRLWEVHAQTRLTVAQAAAALGRSKSWVYGKVRAGELPTLTFDGDLRFITAELRDFIRSRETRDVTPLHPVRRTA
jgi:hypothetical protein